MKYMIAWGIALVLLVALAMLCLPANQEDGVDEVSAFFIYSGKFGSDPEPFLKLNPDQQAISRLTAKLKHAQKMQNRALETNEVFLDPIRDPDRINFFLVGENAQGEGIIYWHLSPDDPFEIRYFEAIGGFELDYWIGYYKKPADINDRSFSFEHFLSKNHADEARALIQNLYMAEKILRTCKGAAMLPR